MASDSVVEEGSRREDKKPRKRTSQGGIISPLLANLYLHEMDRTFHKDKTGPYRMVDARLVRYADYFVIRVRYRGKRIWEGVEGKLEKDLGLSRCTIITGSVCFSGINFRCSGFPQESQELVPVRYPWDFGPGFLILNRDITWNNR